MAALTVLENPPPNDIEATARVPAGWLDRSRITQSMPEMMPEYVPEPVQERTYAT